MAAGPNVTAQNWDHLLCMPFDERTIVADKSVDADDMTPDKCGKECCGAMYFGLVAGRECHCWKGPGHFGSSRASEGCNVTCAGDGDSKCGGEEAADVYVVDQIADAQYCDAH